MLPAVQPLLTEGFITFLFVEIDGVPPEGLDFDLEVTLSSDSNKGGDLVIPICPPL